jgi:hypothetical protein
MGGSGSGWVVVGSDRVVGSGWQWQDDSKSRQYIIDNSSQTNQTTNQSNKQANKQPQPLPQQQAATATLPQPQPLPLPPKHTKLCQKCSNPLHLKTAATATLPPSHCHTATQPLPLPLPLPHLHWPLVRSFNNAHKINATPDIPVKFIYKNSCKIHIKYM